MSTQRDLCLIINDYLDSTTRCTLARVSPFFDAINQAWCARQAQKLLEKCRILNCFSVAQLSAILSSDKLAITHELEEFPEDGTDKIFEYYLGTIDDDPENRADMHALLVKMINRKAVRRVPKCRPIFIFDLGSQLITLDEELSLYLDDKLMLTDVADINFRAGSDPVAITQSGEVYDIDQALRLHEMFVVDHISGIHFIHHQRYLGTEEEEAQSIQISQDPVVFFCSGKRTHLITCERATHSVSTTRASFILSIGISVTSRHSIPTVKMAVEIGKGYLALLDDGSCAIFHEKKPTQPILQAETYDFITRHEMGIIGRRGEEVYCLTVKEDKVVSKKIDNLLSVATEYGKYKLIY